MVWYGSVRHGFLREQINQKSLLSEASLGKASYGEAGQGKGSAEHYKSIIGGVWSGMAGLGRVWQDRGSFGNI